MYDVLSRRAGGPVAVHHQFDGWLAGHQTYFSSLFFLMIVKYKDGESAICGVV